MASEDQIVNVDGFSSSDDERNWVDVGEDDGFDPSELESGTDDGMDDFSDDETGDGHQKRKGHHNELEKKRRKTLNKSYSDLKKVVKRLNGGCRVGGRDRSLELSFRFLKSMWKSLKSQREKCKVTIETLKKMLTEDYDEAEKKEIEGHIKKLTEVSENKLEIRRLKMDEDGENSQEDAEGNSDDDDDDDDDDNIDDDDDYDFDVDDDNVSGEEEEEEVEEEEGEEEEEEEGGGEEEEEVEEEEEHDCDACSSQSGQNRDDEDDPTPCSSPTGKDP